MARTGKTRNRARLGTALALLGLLLTVPAEAKKKKPIYPIDERREVAAGTEIVIADPLVVFDSFNGATRQPDDGIADVTGWLRELALQALEERGFAIQPGDPDDPALSRLHSVADQFVRSRRGPEASDDLIREADAGRGDAVLLQYLEVKLASRGYWDPNTGQLGVGMSNSALKGVLLDAASGEVLWRGELYYRDVPDVDDRKWNAAVAGMYDTLIRGREGR